MELLPVTEKLMAAWFMCSLRTLPSSADRYPRHMRRKSAASWILQCRTVLPLLDLMILVERGYRRASSLLADTQIFFTETFSHPVSFRRYLLSWAHAPAEPSILLR